MRLAVFSVWLVSTGLATAAELPLFFGSGSNFSGPIVRHKIHGDPRREARVSQVDKNITIRMVTMADKAIVLLARTIGGDQTFVSTFQVKNDETIFKTAENALADKAKLYDLASRGRDPFFRPEIYEPREYANKKWIVGLPLLADGSPNVVQREHFATIVLHPLDEDTVQGELLVLTPEKSIGQVLWFDLKREGEKRGPAPGPAAPAVVRPPKVDR